MNESKGSIQISEMPAAWAAEDQEDEYRTPAFDGLKPQWQKFVIEHLRTADHRQAAINSGYGANTAQHRGWTLARRPDIVEATRELVDREMRHAEHKRCQVIIALTADATCSLEDFTNWCPSEDKLVMRSLKDIDPAFRRCVGMVHKSREGEIIFNNTAQASSRKPLASYMKWDREEAFSAPPITFDFSGLKGD
jgi:hypothetical protein